MDTAPKNGRKIVLRTPAGPIVAFWAAIPEFEGFEYWTAFSEPIGGLASGLITVVPTGWYPLPDDRLALETVPEDRLELLGRVLFEYRENMMAEGEVWDRLDDCNRSFWIDSVKLVLQAIQSA